MRADPLEGGLSVGILTHNRPVELVRTPQRMCTPPERPPNVVIDNASARDMESGRILVDTRRQRILAQTLIETASAAFWVLRNRRVIPAQVEAMCKALE